MPIKLLLVEDNPADALFLQSTLNGHSPGQYATTVAATLGEAKSLLVQQMFEAVLLDLSLPDSQGLETITKLAAAAPNSPIVVLTGVADEKIVPEAVRSGAQDYLFKGQSDGAAIVRAIHYAVDRKRIEEELRTQRRELETKNKELQETQKRLEAYRDRYVNLYDFAPLGYVTLDEEGYVQEINLTGAQLLNTNREAITGFSFEEYVVKEDAPVLMSLVRKCVEEHCEVTSELRLKAQCGRLIAVQLHSIPVKGSDEETTFCKTAITDITKRKEMEEAIAHDRNLLRTLIDNLPDCIYVKDKQGRFLVANLATAHLMGAATPNNLLGKTDSDFYPPKLAAEYRADDEELMRSGQPLVNKDEPHLDANGDWMTVFTTKVPLRDDRGKIVGLVGISRDFKESPFPKGHKPSNGV
jgi:PAS domain S-box-containing protein